MSKHDAFWALQGEDLGEFVETPGKLSPVPEHDGTDCLKWDESLWSHADHFKVTSNQNQTLTLRAWLQEIP